MPDFLHEEPGKTVFEGDVLDIKKEHGETYTYEVQNGGWNCMGTDAPDTWLCDQLLNRFEGKRVRVTIEELWPSEDFWPSRQRGRYRHLPQFPILDTSSNGYQPGSDVE
jgi:hypothetical protein